MLPVLPEIQGARLIQTLPRLGWWLLPCSSLLLLLYLLGSLADLFHQAGKGLSELLQLHRLSQNIIPSRLKD